MFDTDTSRLVAAAYCDTYGLNFSTACCTMRLTSVEKDWKHALMEKVVTVNTFCDIACLSFQLPHITTGSWHQPGPRAIFCQFFKVFFTHILVFILLFLSLLCHCFKVMICMYVCYTLFNKYSKFSSINPLDPFGQVDRTCWRCLQCHPRLVEFQLLRTICLEQVSAIHQISQQLQLIQLIQISSKTHLFAHH